MNKVFCFAAFLSALVLSGCAQPTKQAVSLAKETNNDRCLNEYKALQNLNPAVFSIYKKQFETLNDAYLVYKKNGDLMNKDSKEILGLELSDKKRLICARVKSAVFNDIEKRSQAVNDI